MAETIGSRLRAAREAKGMSIEDVAFETRIHARYVRCLETDDYSNFASTTYAKSFLTLYSRFLGVDAAEALHVFAGGDDIRLGGQPLMATIETIESVKAPRAPRTGRRDEKMEPEAKVMVRRESPGFAPFLLGVLVFLLLGTIPALWFLGKDAESIEDVTGKAKEIATATQARLESGDPDASPVTDGAVTEGSDPAAAGTLPEPRPRRERSAIADWVLEEEDLMRSETLPSAGDEDSGRALGKPEPVVTGDSPDATDPPGADPATSPPLIAVAVSDEPAESAVAPAPVVASGGEGIGESGDSGVGSPQAADLPTEDASEVDASPGAMTPEADLPPEPDSETEQAADSPPVATPLRAVPLIARPVVIPSPGEDAEAGENAEGETEEESESEGEMEESESAAAEPEPAPAEPEVRRAEPAPPAASSGGGSRKKKEEEEAEAEEEEEEKVEKERRGFVDPRHRFPRPLRR